MIPVLRLPARFFNLIPGFSIVWTFFLVAKNQQCVRKGNRGCFVVYVIKWEYEYIFLVVVNISMVTAIALFLDTANKTHYS